MMYKCADCGHIFEDGEQAVWYEDRGEYFGMPCGEHMEGCPKCHGYFEDVYECDGCGEWHFGDDLTDGLCESCLKEMGDEE